MFHLLCSIWCGYSPIMFARSIGVRQRLTRDAWIAAPDWDWSIAMIITKSTWRRFEKPRQLLYTGSNIEDRRRASSSPWPQPSSRSFRSIRRQADLRNASIRIASCWPRKVGKLDSRWGIFLIGALSLRLALCATEQLLSTEADSQVGSHWEPVIHASTKIANADRTNHRHIVEVVLCFQMRLTTAKSSRHRKCSSVRVPLGAPWQHYHLTSKQLPCTKSYFLTWTKGVHESCRKEREGN